MSVVKEARRMSLLVVELVLAFRRLEISLNPRRLRIRGRWRGGRWRWYHSVRSVHHLSTSSYSLIVYPIASDQKKKNKPLVSFSLRRGDSGRIKNFYPFYRINCLLPNQTYYQSFWLSKQLKSLDMRWLIQLHRLL